MAADETPPQVEEGELVYVNKGRENQRTFEIMIKLGEGGFGAVYKVKDVGEGLLFAMKTENLSEKCQVLKMEVRVLKALEQGGGRHFCQIVARGRTEKFNFVVMTLAGKSISDLRRELLPPYKFTLGTALRVGIQCLEGIEDMHRIGYIHRDIKPANFANGRVEINEQKKIYILDFGLCRMYRASDGSLHFPRERANFRGTTRYAPLNCFYNKDLSRKDDIETWVYMLTEMTRGHLPWRSLTDKPSVKESKEHARTEEGKKDMFEGCPRQYVNILEYVDMLAYHSQPDYNFIYNKLRSALKKAKVSDDDPFDWEVPERLNTTP